MFSFSNRTIMVISKCPLTSPNSPYPNSYTVSPPPNAGLRYVPNYPSRYRAGDFQDTVIGTGGEAETLHGGFEDGEAGSVGNGVLME